MQGRRKAEGDGCNVGQREREQQEGKKNERKNERGGERMKARGKCKRDRTMWKRDGF